jgi:hypothetical protein
MASNKRKKTAASDEEEQPHQDKKRRVDPSSSSSSSSSTPSPMWADRFAEFVRRCKTHIAEFLKRPNTHYAAEYADLDIVYTARYAKLQTKGYHKSGFAWVDSSTGEVFKPSAGAVNREKAHVKGNIFDAQYGTGMLEAGQLEFKAKEPVRKPDQKKKAPPAIVEDPTPFLGRVFCQDNGSYSAPSFLRIVGWTKSKKRVHLENVPRTPGDWSCQLDGKWVATHPITKPKETGVDLIGILRPPASAGDRPFVVVKGQECPTCDGDDLQQNYSWCEY